MTPPPGFSTPPQIPNITTNERPLATTTVFDATTPENTPFAYRASTSTNPNPTISPVFVEANYEILECLLRERRRQTRNEDLRTELEYFSEDYDEEREMEPRPEPYREATPTLRLRSPEIRRQQERVVGFEDAPNGEGNKRGRNAEGIRSSEIEAREGKNRGEAISLQLTWGETSLLTIGNLPAGSTFAYHPQGGYIPQAFTNNSVPSYNGPMHPTVTPSNSAGSVTSFVRWIEDYPLLDGLKLPSHIGSYDGKGDLDNLLHLFEGAICMQKWLMPVAYHMFTYTLKDSTRIWWNSQKTGSILNYEELKAKFWSHFNHQKKFTKTHLAVDNIKKREGESTRAFITRYTADTLQILGLHEEQQISGFVHGLRTRSLVKHLSTDLLSTYKGLMEKTYTWVEAREVATNDVLNDRRDGFERSKKRFWDNSRRQKNKDRLSPYRGPNHGLLPSLSKSPKEILATKKAARSFEPPPKMFGSKRSRDTSKYCHFHEDYGHDTNDCRYLRTQIQEAVNSGQLSHLVKGIKKERMKSSDITRREGKKDKGATPTEAPILMVNNAPVIIGAKIFGRKVGQVYMDSGSSCKIIYEHWFEKLNPSIKAARVDLKTPLVGFSGERSWSVGEILLEITIGDAPLLRTETLNFIIVRSDSSHNMLLGRTTMQRMGIVVSTIHGAIKFQSQQY
ncbi:reverse transcriptase domain-containing protein [Tanacetum coccineum]